MDFKIWCGLFTCTHFILYIWCLILMFMIYKFKLFKISFWYKFLINILNAKRFFEMLCTSYYHFLIVSRMSNWRILRSFFKYANIGIRSIGECGWYVNFPKNKPPHFELKLHTRLESTYVLPTLEEEVTFRKHKNEEKKIKCNNEK